MDRRPAHGFALLELLIVVAVIAILVGGYFGRDGSSNPQSSVYRRTMNKSTDAACLMNRNTLRTQIELFKSNFPKLPVTTENLQAKNYTVPTCPNGGAYGYTRNGEILCNFHLPPKSEPTASTVLRSTAPATPAVPTPPPAE